MLVQAKKNKHMMSLCMIVKNEEAFLEQSLESVKDAVDEIVIVDTGSEDKTVEIAKRYTENVYFLEWPGSFSAARNFALDHCTGEWILTMDADETLAREDIQKLKAFKNLDNQDIHAIFFVILNDSPDGWATHYSQRLFRNGKARYEGIVHNQLKYKGAHAVSDIRVYHWGYNLSKEKMQAKYKRTHSLLEKQLQENPRDVFAYQNMVRVLRAWKKFKEAVEAGLKGLQVCREAMTETAHQMIAYDTAYCILRVNRVQEAAELTEQILDLFPENLDFLFLKGGILLTERRYEEAVQAFHVFLDQLKKFRENQVYTQLILDSYDFDHKAWGQISDCYFELGRVDESKAAIEKAVSLRPDIPVYKAVLARLLCEKGDVSAAKELMEKTAGDNPGSNYFRRWVAMAQKYPELGDTEQIWKNALEKHHDDDELLNNHAWAVMASQPDKAADSWEKCLLINPEHLGAHTGLCALHAKNNQIDKMKQHAQFVLNHGKSREGLKRAAGACLSAEEYETAIDLLTSYLALEPNDAGALSDVATCYAKMGLYSAAFLGYKKAAELEPENNSVHKNLKVLQELLQTEEVSG